MSDKKSDQSHFIAQIQQKEKESEKMLKDIERENNKRILKANEDVSKIIEETEQTTKQSGQERLRQTKEKAKEEYKVILVEEDKRRRDIIEGGKMNLDKARKHIKDAFIGMFH